MCPRWLWKRLLRQSAFGSAPGRYCAKLHEDAAALCKKVETSDKKAWKHVQAHSQGRELGKKEQDELEKYTGETQASIKTIRAKIGLMNGVAAKTA